MKVLCVVALALVAAMTAGPAGAADAIKIGVIYPLTGNAASAGASAKDAVELGAEIVNTAHPELEGLPLAAPAPRSSSSTSTIRAIPRSGRTRRCG
jgi:branched-chain amino acid transport system substrate-binding protein